MAVVQTQGTGGAAKKPKVAKDVTFVDLEIQTTQEAGGVDLAHDIGGIKAYADVCFLVLFAIFVVTAIVIFIRIPIWQAAGVTTFIAFLMYMVALLVTAFRDAHIEKCMLENGRAPN